MPIQGEKIDDRVITTIANRNTGRSKELVKAIHQFQFKTVKNSLKKEDVKSIEISGLMVIKINPFKLKKLIEKTEIQIQKIEALKQSSIDPELNQKLEKVLLDKQEKLKLIKLKQ